MSLLEVQELRTGYGALQGAVWPPRTFTTKKMLDSSAYGMRSATASTEVRIDTTDPVSRATYDADRKVTVRAADEAAHVLDSLVAYQTFEIVDHLLGMVQMVILGVALITHL